MKVFSHFDRYFIHYYAFLAETLNLDRYDRYPSIYLKERLMLISSWKKKWLQWKVIFTNNYKGCEHDQLIRHIFNTFQHREKVFMSQVYLFVCSTIYPGYESYKCSLIAIELMYVIRAHYRVFGFENEAWLHLS